MSGSAGVGSSIDRGWTKIKEKNEKFPISASAACCLAIWFVPLSLFFCPVSSTSASLGSHRILMIYEFNQRINSLFYYSQFAHTDTACWFPCSSKIHQFKMLNDFGFVFCCMLAKPKRKETQKRESDSTVPVYAQQFDVSHVLSISFSSWHSPHSLCFSQFRFALFIRSNDFLCSASVADSVKSTGTERSKREKDTHPERERESENKKIKT